MHDLLQRWNGTDEFLNAVCSRSGSPDSDARAELRYVVMAAVGSQFPYPPDCSKHNTPDFEERFVSHVCTKLRPTLRNLLELEMGPDELQLGFRRAVLKQCERSRRVFVKRFADDSPPRIGDPGEIQLSAPESSSLAGEAEWECFRQVLTGEWTPPHTAEVLACLENWIDRPQADQAPVTPEGTLDARAVAESTGLTAGQVTRIIRTVRREADKLRTAPRQFRNVYQRLLKFASHQWGSLADTELREELFALSRDLAFSFGPRDAIARGAKVLDQAEFHGVINALLDERSFTDAIEQRTVLERQMQCVLSICEALQAGDLTSAFKQAGPFILDSAHMQHHTSPERLQVLLAYGYLLYVSGSYDACLDVSRGIADRCEAIVASKGAASWDDEPELDGSVTLRRVRTYAMVNHLSCLFHCVLTTARTKVFRVMDYEGLVSVADQLETLIKDDPEATTVNDELLVVQAHVVRAAYNRYHSRVKEDHEHWADEWVCQRSRLWDLIETTYMDKTRDIPDVRRLLTAAETGEGCAVERTLDVLEQELSRYPAALQELRKERLARVVCAGVE
ncbi:MAG: hypothetical protein JXO22_15740 [Phycisphaerae bacterium]|nr:hypothetical protein [Phycisphaerae bacterium]